MRIIAYSQFGTLYSACEPSLLPRDFAETIHEPVQTLPPQIFEKFPFIVAVFGDDVQFVNTVHVDGLLAGVLVNGVLRKK